MPFGALRPSGRIRDFKYYRTAACLIMMVLALAGCGRLPDAFSSWLTSSPGGSPSQNQTASTTAPISADSPPTEQMADHPVNTASAEFSSVPVPAESVESVKPFDTYPEGSLGVLGLNLDTYFDRDLKTGERLDRLETAMLAMHRDLKKMAPPIQRLITVEKDISSLVTQLQDFVQAEAPPPGQPSAMQSAYSNTAPPGYYAQPPPQNASSIPPPAQTYSPPPAGNSGGYQPIQATGSGSVRQLRIGEHNNKTRIVLDISGPATYRYDLDNAERILVITLPGTSWSGQMQAQFAKSPLIASYTVSPDQNGSRVVLQLKQNTSVSYEIMLKPDKNSRNYRLVIDLKK